MTLPSPAAFPGTPPTPGLAPPPRRALHPASRQVIFIACPWTPVGGGMFKVAQYLIESQAPSPGAPDLVAPPALLQPLDTRGEGSAWGSLWVLGRAVARLARSRLAGNVAGVHVNMAERMSLVRKCVVVVACRLLAIPVVVHLHAAQLHRAWPHLPGGVRAVVRAVFRLPRACVVLGPQSAQFVTSALGVPAHRVEIVTNGVPAPLVARRTSPGTGLRLLFAGNLSDRKGLPELLQAMADPALARLPVTLTVAGGGDIAHYRAQADRLGLDGRVEFLGWTPGPDLAGWMAQADALVLPSHDEGLPLVVLEALAIGLPVVCTPVGEVPDHLEDDRHACFVPPGDVRALARTLARVLGDAGLRQRLALEGRTLWQREFSMDRFFARIAAVHARCFGVAACLPVAAGSSADAQEEDHLPPGETA
jgi:glycosyltransferase involved in cell wall biosynthesis